MRRPERIKKKFMAIRRDGFDVYLKADDGELEIFYDPEYKIKKTGTKNGETIYR